MLDRRARTRRLIELGGLVVKSGLEEVVAAVEPDARAVILGALLQLADELRERESDAAPPARITAWRDRGRESLRTAGRDEADPRSGGVSSPP